MATSKPEQSQPLTVPVRAEFVRFEAGWTADEGQRIDIDLSCVSFNSNGELIEAVHFGNPEAVQGSVVRKPGDGGGDVIEVCPSRVLHECEVLCLVLSAADSNVRQMDLNTPKELTFNIYALEKNKPQETLCSMDLKEYVGEKKETPNRLSDGHQSMVLCMLYRVGNGWHVHFVLETHPLSCWGDLIPEVKESMRKLPELEGVQNIPIDATERVVISRPGEDRTIAEASHQRELAQNFTDDAWAVPTLSGVRLDVGWELHDPEAEDVTVEFNCVMYNAEGEEVQAVNIGSPEAEGARVEEKQEEPPAEEDGEQPEEGEEGNTAEKEEKEEKKEEQGPPIKASVFLTLPELPKNVRSIVLTFTNLAGSGMGKVKTIYTRLQDTSSAATPRDALTHTFTNPGGANSNLTGFVACKLYKEFADDAYGWWRSTGMRDINDFAEKADMKSMMSQILQGKKEYSAKLAAAQGAEEAGEENMVHPQREFDWRCRTLSVLIPGESADDHQPYIDELAAFEGRQTPSCQREDRWSKVVFRNGDSFFGSYMGGKRSSLGFYVFANGGSYIGEYEEGKRCGSGVMMLPDGGFYKGQLAADKFHGEGAYFYPDGSCYTGKWENGLKHGLGVYWDKHGGCLQGDWKQGVLHGQSTYGQEAYNFKGNMVKGIPAGDCTFTICASRTTDLPQTATAFVMSDNGPTLSAGGVYNIPAGAGEDPPEREEPSEEQGLLPKFPNYDGLTFTPESKLPELAVDILFPPKDAEQLPSLVVG